MTRFVYARGFKSFDAALDAMEDLYADGEISSADQPSIERYRYNGQTRFCITLNG